MAIKNGLDLKGGIRLSNVYINICSYTLYKQEKECKVYLSAYKDEERYKSGGDKLPWKENIPEVIKNTDEVSNFDTYLSNEVLEQEGVCIESQIYNYIKTLPEYEKFDDVLE